MFKLKVFLIACGILFLLSSYSFAKVPTMMVSELQPGMKGIGKTVIRGTDVESFNVEIIGIIKKGGFNGGPMILIKCTGPVIDATGGIAGGFSGSPVFIDGKIIGALSAAWYFADHSIAGVTPINEMLKNFYFSEKSETGIQLAKLDKPIELFGKTIDSTILGMDDEATKKLENNLNENTMVLTACRTPLFINGLSPQLVDKVKEFLGPKLPYIEIMAGSGGGMDDKNWEKITLIDNRTQMEPGSALGMQLVTGDMDFTAVGTLTYFDPEDADMKILAFGHPFLQKGKLDAPLTSARIVFTVPALDRSFKIGEAISVIGSSSQDRACAISGVLGKAPDLVKVHLEINDIDQDQTKKFDLGVLRDEDLMPFLTLLPLMQGLAQTMDRSGRCTIKSSFTVKGEGLAEPITRNNVYFSDFSGMESINELMEVISTLTAGNIFREVSIDEVDVKIDLTENRQTLDIVGIEFIEEAKKQEEKPAISEPVPPSETQEPQGVNVIRIDLQQAPQQTQATTPEGEAQPIVITQPEIKRFKPGDNIRMKVTLKPYREESFEETLELKIPEDITAGITQIVVRGGGGIPNRFMMGAAPIALVQDMNMMPGMIPMPMPEKPPKSLDEIIEKILKRDHNNELVIELMRPMNPNPQKKEDEETLEPIKLIQPRDKIIYGVFQLPIEIKKPEEQKKEGPQAKPGETVAPKEGTSPEGETKPPAEKEKEPSKRKDFKYKSKK